MNNYMTVNKPILFLLALLLIANAECLSQNKFGIVIHGGAGTIKKENMSPEKEEAYKSKLKEALLAGYQVLENGGSSLDAVEAAIKIMEDSPLFNAGKGAVFTEEGTVELDVSIMDGKTLSAGAAAALKHVKNPITLARKIMENSPHVILVGEGAEKFAGEQKLEMVDQKYFYTKERWDALQREKAKEQKPKEKHGTVGAVALDKSGNIAAGTSTGGMTNKKWGRVGDSPIIGAGTYANNNTCGVSGTGHGEYFIRLGIAKDISALMEYKGLTLQQAAEEVINKLTRLGGTGGVVALDKNGNVAMPFNTSGMYRACYISGSEPVIKIYKE